MGAVDIATQNYHPLNPLGLIAEFALGSGESPEQELNASVTAADCGAQ